MTARTITSTILMTFSPGVRLPGAVLLLAQLVAELHVVALCHRRPHLRNWAHRQYQPWASSWSHAACGVPYVTRMYPMPQMIWVYGSVAQSGPADAIFAAGSA